MRQIAQEQGIPTSPGSKAFVLQESSGSEATAEALAKFLNVDLRRKGGDPWKETL